MLTNERAELIANYLTSDKERGRHLLTLEPEEAVSKMNADGNDFTVEEIIEFGKQLQIVSTQDEELDVEDLDNVAGGSITLGGLLGAAFVVKVAYDIGKAIGKNAPW